MSRRTGASLTRLTVALAACLAALFEPAGALDAGRLSPPVLPPETWQAATPTAAVDQLVERAMADQRVPGLAVAIVGRGQVVLAKGYGLSNLEHRTPVTPETMFQSGSLGKQLTAAGVMALVEDGRINLDASIRTYLPGTPESWQPITTRHLLTHSSGIPDYTGDDFDYRRDYSDEELVGMATRLELEFPAGSRWNYSNTGYVLLGVIIGRLAGQPYWEFLRERIFDPAGMKTIRVNTESDIVPYRAQGYLPAGETWRHANWVAPSLNRTADGSMLLNLDDLIAWNDVVRNRRVLSARSWELMQSPMTLTSGRPYPYGFGWRIGEAGGQVVHEHGGSWQGFMTQLTRYTGDDLAVIVLANSSSARPGEIATGIAALMNPAFAPPPPPSEPIEDPDPAATAYVREMLAKISRGELALSDFAFIRQTSFPGLRRALTRTLEGLGEPGRLEFLARTNIGDDRELQYFAWYGERRFRVVATLGPNGGLTGLRVTEEPR